MGARKPCANCKRELTVVGDGCCFVCHNAGKGLEGEEKEAALAAVKAKIESGGLRRCGHYGGPRKSPTGWGAAKIPGPVEQAAGKKKRKSSRTEGPCCNCGRVMQIQARDACSACYPASKIENGEDRDLALMKIRRKLGVKEFAEDAGAQRQIIPDASASKIDAGKGSYPKAADIMRDVRGPLLVIILSAEEMGFIEALRAGRIAIIS